MCLLPLQGRLQCKHVFKGIHRGMQQHHRGHRQQQQGALPPEQVESSTGSSGEEFLLTFFSISKQTISWGLNFYTCQDLWRGFNGWTIRSHHCPISPFAWLVLTYSLQSSRLQSWSPIHYSWRNNERRFKHTQMNHRLSSIGLKCLFKHQTL